VLHCIKRSDHTLYIFCTFDFVVCKELTFRTYQFLNFMNVVTMIYLPYLHFHDFHLAMNGVCVASNSLSVPVTRSRRTHSDCRFGMKKMVSMAVLTQRILKVLLILKSSSPSILLMLRCSQMKFLTLCTLHCKMQTQKSHLRAPEQRHHESEFILTCRLC
jgi:hypothetical protein